MPRDGSKKGNPPTEERPRPRWETTFKWVSGITGVLALGFGLNQALQLTSDIRERQRQIAEFQTVARQQQDAGDFAGAWASLEQALKAAETGGRLAKLFGRLSEERATVRTAQEDLAMEWLRNARVSEGQTFTKFVEQPVAILNRGLPAASGARRADLLAHVGWATFLRARESSDLNPEALYQQAVQSDSANPYAHAHWGHWLLWRQDRLPEANQHFAAAAASGRALPYVRMIQLAALKNAPDRDDQFLRVVDAMRRNNERIDTQTRSDLFAIYSFACALRRDNKRMAQLLAAVPADAQLSTFRTLFYGEHEASFDVWKGMGRAACLATLLEAAGRREEALEVWRALRQQPEAQSNGMAARARDTIRRLTSGG
jgi:hypothetical protein